MDVQYRSPDITLVNNQTAIAKSNTAGVLEVISSPGPVPAGGETIYQTGAYVTEANVAGALALTKLYVGLNTPLVGTGPFYVVIVDSAGPLAGGDLSVIPTPPMNAAGDFFYWEPPGGAQFTTGICVGISSTPLVYTASNELCAVTLWTVP
jgi:hypothetical protein